MAGISRVWRALSDCLVVVAGRGDVNAKPAFSFVIFFPCEKKILFRGWEGPSWSKREADCGTKILLSKQKPTCVNRKCLLGMAQQICDEKCYKCVRKHLKRRCLADVSPNASSSSDTASCLSPIHMLMFNQAGQSQKRLHIFFQVFPSNQFTLERDKSLKSHIRGEGSKW